MGWSAFSPKGMTVTIAVSNVASTAVQVPGDSSNCYLISNAGTVGCFLAWGGNSSTPAGTVVAAVPPSTCYCVWLPPNSVQAFTFGPQTWFSAITAASTTTVYITPGDGL